MSNKQFESGSEEPDRVDSNEDVSFGTLSPDKLAALALLNMATPKIHRRPETTSFGSQSASTSSCDVDDTESGKLLP